MKIQKGIDMTQFEFVAILSTNEAMNKFHLNENIIYLYKTTLIEKAE